MQCAASTEEQKIRIVMIADLTLGDIKAVWLKLRYTDFRNVSHGQVIDELYKEVSYKKSGNGEKIGF